MTAFLIFLVIVLLALFLVFLFALLKVAHNNEEEMEEFHQTQKERLK